MEYAADRTAIQFTHDPESAIRALARLHKSESFRPHVTHLVTFLQATPPSTKELSPLPKMESYPALA
jgi:Zn-dependent protease with chaperone function